MDESHAAIPIDELLQHHAWVHEVARRLVFAEQDVDDVEQNAWLSALEDPPRDRSALRGWLATVLRRGASRAVRAETRRRTRELASARREAAPPAADVVTRAELHERVVRAVLGLAEPYRSTILLRFYEGLPVQEIAERVGAPPDTVKSRLRRGLGMLREGFEAEHRSEWRAVLLPLAGAAAGKSATAAAGGLVMLTKAKAAVLIGLTLMLSVSIAVWFNAKDGKPSQGNGAPAAPQSEVASLGVPKEPPRAPEPPDVPPPAEEPAGHRFAVVDTAAKPVASADLLVVREGEKSTRLKTGPQGISVLDGVTTGKATVWASAAGFASLRQPGVDLATRETRLQLAPGRDLRVRFVTPKSDTIAASDARQRYEGQDVRAALVCEAQFKEGDVSRHIETVMQDRRHWYVPTTLVWDESGARTAMAPPPGEWRLFLTRPHATPFLSTPFESATGSPEATVILEDAPAERRVRVVDAGTRAPLDGASVTPYFEIGDDQGFIPGIALRTDKQGEVVLPLKESGTKGRPPTWWVETPTHFGAVPEFRFAKDELVEIEVPKRAGAFGKAWLRSGTPAAGRLVVSFGKGMVSKAVVDLAGDFRIEPLVWIGEPQARLLLMEDLARLDANMVSFKPEPGAATHIDIGRPGSTGVRLSGRITSGGDGVRGASVSLTAPNDRSKRHVTTASDGRFAFEGLEPGPYYFSIYLGDSRAVDDFVISSKGALKVEKENRPLEFALPAGAIEASVVDDETGKPIPRAVAFAKPQKDLAQEDRFPGFQWLAGWGGFCDDRGVGILRALIEGSPHEVSAGAEGYAERGQKDVLPGSVANPTRVTIRLKKK